MNKETYPEFISALVFCVIAFLLLNPRDFWMPSMAHLTMLAIGAAAFGAFVLIIMRERAVDEREALHRSAAGRAAFLAGSAVLLLGIAMQSYAHVDPWLVYGLVAMVLAKVGARIWTTLYR